MGSFLPPVELARQDLTLLRKLSVYFLFVLVGNMEKSRETGRSVRRHRTLASASGVRSVLGPIRVEHRMQGVPCSCVRCGLS